jgi:hypothetical protein
VRQFIIILFAAIASLISTADAATTSGETNYEVEVLVFENRLPELEGGELWTQDRTQPLGPEAAGALTVGAALPESNLTPAAAALEVDGRHRILTHKRWLQSADAKSTTKLMRINNGTGELDGTFRFYLSRFLHIEVNLAFRELGEPTLYGALESVPGQIYRIVEQRRIKSKDVHYFDNPKFGALVRVAPITP